MLKFYEVCEMKYLLNKKKNYKLFCSFLWIVDDVKMEIIFVFYVNK